MNRLFVLLFVMSLCIASTQATELKFQNPKPGSDVRGTTFVHVLCDEVIDGVRFVLNGTEVAVVNASGKDFETSLDTGGYSDGSYALRAEGWRGEERLVAHTNIHIINEEKVMKGIFDSLEQQGSIVETIYFKIFISLVVIAGLILLVAKSTPKKRRETEKVVRGRQVQGKKAEQKVNVEPASSKIMSSDEISQLLGGFQEDGYKNQKYDVNKHMNNDAKHHNQDFSEKSVEPDTQNNESNARNESSVPKELEQKDESPIAMEKPADEPEDHLSMVLCNFQEEKKGVDDDEIADDSLMQLEFYIDEMRKKDVPEERIQAKLKREGWPEETVEKYFN